MFVTFGDYAFFLFFIFCIVHPEMNLVEKKKRKRENGYMSYDNFEHSCDGERRMANGGGGSTLSRGYSYSKKNERC